eukprot:9264635-Karenia_brevis.AAC.1
MDTVLYGKAGGKGRNGSPPAHMRRTNPIGPDGNPLECSICKSTTHFRKFCPQNPQGKGGGRGR